MPSALSNSSNFVSVSLPLYLYITSSRLTFLSKSVIFSSLSSTSLLNISFCLEINGVSLGSYVYFLIVILLSDFKVFKASTCFFLHRQLFLFVYQRLYLKENK